MKTQVIDDFQCLCNHCNLQKRQVSRENRDTGIRHKGTQIASVALYGVDYTHGDETFNPTDINAMVGTYWYDLLILLKRHVKSGLIKN